MPFLPDVDDQSWQEYQSAIFTKDTDQRINTLPLHVAPLRDDWMSPGAFAPPDVTAGTETGIETGSLSPSPPTPSPPVEEAQPVAPAVTTPTTDFSTHATLRIAGLGSPGETTPSTTTSPSPGGGGGVSGISGSPELITSALNAADQAGVDPGVFLSLVQQESSFNPAARSPVGAQGLTQLMPATARGLGVTDPNDPIQSLQGGARYLRQQMDRFGGDVTKALAAYNAGPGAVEQYGGIPPYKETQRYVSSIMDRLANEEVPTATGTAPGAQEALGRVGSGLAEVNAGRDISQFGDPQLGTDEAYAACGPAAAVRFAEKFGRNPTLREAVDLAKQVGWTSAQGMAGLGSEQQLMDKLNVPTKLVQGAQWDVFAKEAQTGNPVTISTSGHYFTADGYDPTSGAFHVGRSGLDLKGGKEWMTPTQMTALMGQVQGGLLADNPQVPAPSTADQSSNPLDWLGKAKDAIVSGIGDAFGGGNQSADQQPVSSMASGPITPLEQRNATSMVGMGSDALTNPLGTGNAPAGGGPLPPDQSQQQQQPQQTVWDKIGQGISDVFKNAFGGNQTIAPEGGGYGAVPAGGINPVADAANAVGPTVARAVYGPTGRPPTQEEMQANLQRGEQATGTTLQFPQSPLDMLGSAGLGAPTSGEALTAERNQAIEQANPLRDVPVVGGATTLAAQTALDPTNLLLAGEPGVARSVGRAAGELGEEALGAFERARPPEIARAITGPPGGEYDQFGVLKGYVPPNAKVPVPEPNTAPTLEPEIAATLPPGSGPRAAPLPAQGEDLVIRGLINAAKQRGLNTTEFETQLEAQNLERAAATPPSGEIHPEIAISRALADAAGVTPGSYSADGHLFDQDAIDSGFYDDFFRRVAEARRTGGGQVPPAAPPPAPPTPPTGPPTADGAGAGGAGGAGAGAGGGRVPPQGPPPPAPPGGMFTPEGEAVPFRTGITPETVQIAHNRIDRALPIESTANAAAHERLNRLLANGAAPDEITRFLSGNIEGNTVSPTNILRTVRTGSMAGGITTEGKVLLGPVIQTAMRAPVGAIKAVLQGEPGNIRAGLQGGIAGLAEGAAEALQTIRYGTPYRAALTGSAEGGYGFRPGLDVMGSNVVTRALGTAALGLVRTHGAIGDISAGIGRGAARAQGASPERAAEIGQQWALRSGNYGTIGRFVSNQLEGLRRESPGFDVVGQLLIPFYRVGYNAFTQGIERSPVGLVGTGIDVARGVVGQGPYAANRNLTRAVTPVADRLANNMFGVGLATLGFAQAAQGNIVGENPPAGAPKWSVRVPLKANLGPLESLAKRDREGNLWVPIRHLGPAGEALAQSAILYDATQHGGDVSQIATRAAEAYVGHVYDDTWLRSIGDVFGVIGGVRNITGTNAYAARTAERELQYQATSLGKSFIPQEKLLEQIRKTIPDYKPSLPTVPVTPTPTRTPSPAPTRRYVPPARAGARATATPRSGR